MSGKALQYALKWQFSGEAKHSKRTPNRAPSTANTSGRSAPCSDAAVRRGRTTARATASRDSTGPWQQLAQVARCRLIRRCPAAPAALVLSGMSTTVLQGERRRMVGADG